MNVIAEWAWDGPILCLRQGTVLQTSSRLRSTNVAVLAIRREDLHARPGRGDDAGLFLEGLAVENINIVLAADRDPDFVTVRGEEGLVRSAADVSDVLHLVCRGVDEGD